MHRPVLSASLHLTRACLSALRLLRSSPLIRSWMLLASWLSAEGLQMGAAASTAGSETAGPPHEQRAFWPPWSTAARFATAPHWSSNVWSSIASHKLYQSSPDCLHSQPNPGLTPCTVFSLLSDWARKTLTMISTALLLPYCCFFGICKLPRRDKCSMISYKLKYLQNTFLCTLHLYRSLI